MTNDVEIVVGISADASGARVIKKSLDDIATSGDKAISSADRLKAATQKAGSGFKEAASYVVNYDVALKKGLISKELYNQKMAQTGASIGKVNSLFSVGAGLIAAYFGAQTIGAIKDTAMQAEALRYRMDAAIGTFGDAGKAMAYVRAESERLGLNFKDTAGSFASFAASGLRAGLSMKDVKDIFTGTSEAIRALKLSDEQAKSVFLALEQMAGKGVVQMQELKLQLGAALPGAIEIFAKAMGKTPAQFYAMVSAGEVTVDSLKVLGKAFHDEFGEAAVAASDSAISAQNRLQNSLFETGDALGNSTGIMSAYKDALGGLAKFITGDPLNAMTVLRGAVLALRVAFDVIATAIGISFAIAINTIKNQINDVLNLFNSLKTMSNNNFGTKFQKTDLLTTGSNLDILKDGASSFNSNTARLMAENNALANPVSKAYNADSQGFDTGPSTAALKKSDRDARKAERDAERAHKKEMTDALRLEKKQHDEVTQAIKGSRTETEKLTDEIANLERLKGFAKTKQEVDLLTRGIKNTQDELDKLRVKAELNSPTAKAFASLASEIDDGFKNAFKDAFTASDGGFKKLIEGWKNTFKSFLADLAYQALVRPIVLSIVGGVGGAMGLSNNAVASVLGQVTGAPGIAGGGTGGGGAGSFGNLFSVGSSLFSAGSSLLSGGSSALLTTGLNRVGNLLGIGGVGANGPISLSSYSSFTNGSFGGSLGAGLGGFGGNMLANAIFGGNRGIGATIGGTIGTVAGSFIPVPILGPAFGGFVGNAIGGLFGGGRKPSDKSQSGTIDFATLAQSTSGMTGKKYSAQNAAARDSILGQISGVLGLVQQYGGSATGSASVTIGNRDGLRYNGQNYGQNAQAFSSAIFGDLRNSITGLDKTFTTILDKLGVGNSIDNLTKAFQFGQSYNDTLNPKTAASQLADGIKVLNDNMTNLLATASQLGLPIEEYTKALQKQKDAAIGTLKAQAAGFQTLEDMTKTFKAFFDGQALGANSSLSPTQKLQLAQDNFGGLLTKAQGGDLSVTQDLLKAANELLDIGRGVYASSVSFAGLEGFVRSSVAGVAKSAGYEGTETAQGLTAEIIRGNTQLNGSVSELVDLMRDLYAEAVRTRKLQESIRNQGAAA